MVVVLAVVALTLSATAGQAAPPKKLGVGLYAPELLFANPGERHGLVLRLAQHLESALGVKVQGRAYKASADLERDARTKRIQFAVLGAVYLASRRAPVVARAKNAPATWSILTRKKTTLAELKGKVLQIPRLGPLTARFVENGLLGGNLVLKTHFKVAQTPDLYSSISSVKLGRADAVFAPVATQGLVATIPGVPVAPPGFAILDRKLDPEIRAKATQALLQFGAAIGGIHGWRPSGSKPYAAIAGASQKRVNNMILSAVKVERLRDEELINLSLLHPALPEMEDLFWIP
jgi:ABC-type amino acid transport substrate-binding protein